MQIFPLTSSPQQGFSSNDSVEMTTAWQEARLGFENRTTSGTEIYS